MKFDRQKAFPYPVLRPYSDDFIDVDFQTTVDFSIGNEKIEMKIQYAISSEEIVDEIEKDCAEYVCVVSCRETYFRSVISSKENTTDAQFDIGELRGEVKVDPYVVVKKSINDFISEDINQEFGSGPFSYNAGDILAQDESQVIFIERDFMKPVTSVFELVKKDSLSGGEWTIDYHQDHIQLGVSSKMKEVIDDARNTKENQIILLNSIYFSAVMQCIQLIKDSPLEYVEYKWAQVIEKQAHNKNIDLAGNDSYILAQRLMEYPLSHLNTYVFKEVGK